MGGKNRSSTETLRGLCTLTYVAGLSCRLIGPGAPGREAGPTLPQAGGGAGARAAAGRDAHGRDEADGDHDGAECEPAGAAGRCQEEQPRSRKTPGQGLSVSLRQGRTD